MNKDLLKIFEDIVDRSISFEIEYTKWDEIISTFSKEDVLETLTHFIKIYNIKLPYKEYDILVIEKLFKNLYFDTCNDLWAAKGDYTIKYYGVHKDKCICSLTSKNVYNRISDNYQHKNRFNCKSRYHVSLNEGWKNIVNWSGRNLLFYKDYLNYRNINHTIIHEIYRLYKYLPSQFKVSVTKAIYHKHKAENILDHHVDGVID